eukprot:656390-Pelagomonas_calceolata.AAC.1
MEVIQICPAYAGWHVGSMMTCQLSLEDPAVDICMCCVTARKCCRYTHLSSKRMPLLYSCPPRAQASSASHQCYMMYNTVLPRWRVGSTTAFFYSVLDACTDLKVWSVSRGSSPASAVSGSIVGTLHLHTGEAA